MTYYSVFTFELTHCEMWNTCAPRPDSVDPTRPQPDLAVAKLANVHIARVCRRQRHREAPSGRGARRNAMGCRCWGACAPLILFRDSQCPGSFRVGRRSRYQKKKIQGPVSSRKYVRIPTYSLLCVYFTWNTRIQFSIPRIPTLGRSQTLRCEAGYTTGLQW